MYADVMVIFSESILGLQKVIGTLTEHRSKCLLSVDIYKTKIVVFRKGGKVHVDENSYKGNTEIEVVDNSAYLATTDCSVCFKNKYHKNVFKRCHFVITFTLTINSENNSSLRQNTYITIY